jgi:preprotein translocase subunit SecD
VDRPKLIGSLAAFLVVVVAAGVYLATGARPNLGLDLQGGIEAIYTPTLQEGQEIPEDFAEIVDEAIEVIRNRVDSLGVAEPEISRSGTDDPIILVQLPGVTEEERVRELIGTTAQLTFRPVERQLTPEDERFEEVDCSLPIGERPVLPNDQEGVLCGVRDEAFEAEFADDPEAAGLLLPRYLVRPVAVTGDSIDNAIVVLGQGQNAYEVSVSFDRAGGEAFAETTAGLACERDQLQDGRLAIVLDDEVLSALNMGEGVACGVGITGGTSAITVGGSTAQEQQREAEDLALVLRAGALPISLDAPDSFETVSPTLGAESLRSGLLAGLIGLALVGIWLVFFYRWLGVVALLSLGVFGILVFALITLLGEVGFALTLAGVAGLIVSIGITADSSIIYFERIRDEVNLGKTVRTATKKAFSSAFRTNLAGNTVTLAAAGILYFLAVGPVRGFALMLGMATLLDLIIMYFFTRPVVGLLSGTRLLDRRSVRAADTAPVPVGGRA